MPYRGQTEVDSHTASQPTTGPDLTRPPQPLRPAAPYRLAYADRATATAVALPAPRCTSLSLLRQDHT
jgi:hypothetical protein